MGTAASREHSSRHKYRQKLIIKKSPKNSNNTKKLNEQVASTSQAISQNPVNLIKHQLVLSDNASPLSSLTTPDLMPLYHSSWRKSMNTIASRTSNDNASIASSYFEDFEQEINSSPITSLGSDNTGFVIEDSNGDKKKKKMTFSFPSFINNSYKKEGHNIIFESKYMLPISLSPSIEDQLQSPRPFWSYNYGDENEYDRQIRQHYVLKHIFNGNIHIPIPADSAITILDSACGAGFWTLDMAHTFPKSKIISLDIFPRDESKLQGTNTGVNAPNVVYKYGDFTTHLTLPDCYLDIIYQRDAISIMPSERWSFLFDEFMRVLKPGGFIELVEYDFNLKDPGPVLSLINEWYKIASTTVGVNTKEVKCLEKRLVSAGFVDVEKKVVSIPIGEWPTDEEEKEKGFLYKHVIRALFKSMKYWWTSELGVSEEEYDRVISAAMDEFDEQCCYIDWFIYTAKKPTELPVRKINNVLVKSNNVTFPVA